VSRRAPVVLAALAGAAAIAVSAAGAQQPTPARVQVTADEFTLALSRTTIRRGLAVVELVNLGEDDHDLALRRIAKGARVLRIPATTPGGIRTLEAALTPGRYRLWCTIAGHRRRGMHALLVVRPR
jgi:hypothetical protein